MNRPKVNALRASLTVFSWKRRRADARSESSLHGVSGTSSMRRLTTANRNAKHGSTRHGSHEGTARRRAMDAGLEVICDIPTWVAV